jgi:hypothetical protein
MPIYHFNVRDGVDYPDRVGSDLPDLAAARAEAVRRISDILNQGAADFWSGAPWNINVSDSKGLTLFTIMCLATTSPLAPAA